MNPPRPHLPQPERSRAVRLPAEPVVSSDHLSGSTKGRLLWLGKVWAGRVSLYRRLVVLLLTISVLLGCAAILPTQPAAAVSARCLGNPTFAFGRKKWCGYFNNDFFTTGRAVRNAGVPASVDRANELINLLVGDLHSGNAQRRTGAQFVILTMLGRSAGLPKSVTEPPIPNNQLETWKQRVLSYANTSENGLQSFGENGRIDWSVWEHLNCGFVNTFYQVAQDDVAPFANDTDNSECDKPWVKEQFILFRDIAGNVIYRIRRACMNPMGVLKPLDQPKPQPEPEPEPEPNDQYDLSPSITTFVNGGPVSGGVEVGDTLQFSYSVANSGSDASPSAACSIYSNTHSGYFDARGNPAPGGTAGPATGCPKVFGGKSTQQLGAVESLTIVAGNQTICRSLFVSPASPTVGQRGIEACVPVVNKPYFRVYGGDISAGNGQPTAAGGCAPNQDAAVIGWNQGPSGFAGAGADFAVLALSQIYEAASAMGTSAPSGLAFSNINPSGSVYGGDFGSLPCVSDYYADLSSSTSIPFASLAAADTSGAYSSTPAGNALNLSGKLRDGKRIVLYVDGDVFISGDITYPDTWTLGSQPMFMLVAKGNIFIHRSVSRIDGVFVAQSSSNTGGIIYTCTSGPGPLAPDDKLNNVCNSDLTINGSFVAKQVQFLRTRGTAAASSVGEVSGSSNIAETFNFGPAFWMPQPINASNKAVRYDSIISLPPVL